MKTNMNKMALTRRSTYSPEA